MRGKTWEVFPMKSVYDHNVLPLKWNLDLNRKPDCTISKFKAQYCVIEYVQKILYPESSKLYSPVVQ